MVKITLPNPNEFEGNVKGFLRQLELAVHHAQKSYQAMVEDGEINDSESSYVSYRFPLIDLYERSEDPVFALKDGYVRVHVDEEGDQMQNIVLEINQI